MMVMLSPDQHAELVAAREQRDEILALLRGQSVEELANYLVCVAGVQGLVLTIEQRPRVPLAMGNYETVVSVREQLARAAG
jgi:hypothetical protein